MRLGDEHVANAAVSTRHSNRAPVSLDVNTCVTVLALMPDGPDVIVVFGTDVSTVHVRVAGDASMLPATSTALTANVCAPSARPPNATGVEQAAKLAASSLHSNATPVSVDENAKLADVALTDPVGPAVSVVDGAVTSTIHVRVAGEPSTFPTASIARTENVCDPDNNELYAFGDAHTP